MILRSIMNVNVGDLTEIKIKRIQDILNKDFPSGVSNNIQLIATGNKEQIIITPNTIEYINNEGVFEKYIDLMKNIFDLLMLDDNITQSTLILTDIIDNKEYSMVYLQEKYVKLTKDAIGLGLRSFFNFNNSLCEFRVEPYLSDPKKMYIEGTYNLSNNNINELESVIKSVKEDYTIKKEGLDI